MYGYINHKSLEDAIPCMASIASLFRDLNQKRHFEVFLIHDVCSKGECNIDLGVEKFQWNGMAGDNTNLLLDYFFLKPDVEELM